MSDNEKNPEDGQSPIQENEVFENPNDLNIDTQGQSSQFEDADDFSFQQPENGASAPQDPIEPEILEAETNSNYPHDEDFSDFGEDLSLDALSDDFTNEFGDDLEQNIDTGEFSDDFSDDIDAFGEDWNEEQDLDGEFGDDYNSDMDFASEEEDEGAPSGNAASPLAGLMQNKAVKFGGIGAGSLIAVAVLYFFVLDDGSGGIPSQQLQQQPPQQAANQQPAQPVAQTAANTPALAALDAPSNNDNMGSVFDNIDSIPAIDKVEGQTIQDIENGGTDIFDMLEESPQIDDSDTQVFSDNTPPTLDLPEPTPAQNNDFLPQPVMNTNNSSSNSPFDFDSEFGALPTPTPISSETAMASPKPGQALDEPAVAMNNNEAQSFDIMLGDSSSQNDEFSEFEIDTPAPVSPMNNTDNTPARSAMNSTPSAEMGEVSAQLAKLNDRLDRMDNRIEQLERGKSGGSSSSDMARIERMIERLEGRIEDLADSKQVMASNSRSSSSSSASSNTSSSSSSVKKASVDTSAPVVKKAAPAKKRSASASSWSLRGAGPGQAYVAKNGSDEIKTVRVGDNVSGLGSIKFIGLEKGRWVVKTSNGTIRQ